VLSGSGSPRRPPATPTSARRTCRCSTWRSPASRGGQFILRIEDTDRARYVADSEQQVFDTLHWLGLDWDEGPDKGGPYAPYRQSERTESYRVHVDRLLADGHAYHCWCSTERLARCARSSRRPSCPPATTACASARPARARRRCRLQRAAGGADADPDDVPLVFDDVIRGEVKAPRPDDQVIVKADGFPTYHLANVVDDHEMGITHVVRGEEWISSTPKHVLLYDWLGWDRPEFAHMPLLRNTDKSKISKRKNPAARLTWFLEQGYLPEALRNFLALMGYSQPDGEEIFTFDDMVRDFDWDRVNTVGPVFDLDKLNWLNGHYIRELSVEDLAGRIIDHLVRRGVLPSEPTSQQRDLVLAATPLVNERMQVLSEAEGMLGFLLVDEADFAVDPDDAAKVLTGDAAAVLSAAVTALSELATWATADIEAALRASLVEGLGLKPKVAFGAVRVAVTGRRVSPPLFESLGAARPDRSLARLRAAAATVAG
jgi:glutamyl-tRNA synthetase